jgi:hypothetical protein
MYRKLSILFTFLFAFITVGTTLAQGPAPQHTDPQWQVSYWNNMSLSGTPIVQTAETNLDWNWGQAGPANVPADNFSARWTKYIDVAAGSYRFTATADDGIRVYVDNTLLINQWSDHPATTYTADINLPAGHHLVTVEYYENTGLAVAKLVWAATPAPVVNWQGDYFNNKTLSGSPTFTRDDAAINFDWGSGGPGNGLGNDNFSIRWTRTLNFQPDNYTFTTTGDDGVRLWVNGHLLIDKWFDQPATNYSGTLYLSGNVSIQMEYYENGGNAAAKLVWTTGGPPPPPPPPGGAVIVNETDASFVKGGSASGWHTANLGYNNNMLWTKNNDYLRSNYNWGRWYPALTARKYEVFVYVPANYATTTNARYWISHRDGFSLKVLNQMNYSNQWVSLGTYTFQGNSNDYVSLSDVTFEAYLSRYVGFDAVKWEPR